MKTTSTRSHLPAYTVQGWSKGIHQLKRTLIAFCPQLISKTRLAELDTWAMTLLSPSEQALYFQMDVRDRLHGALVAQALQQRHPQASCMLLKAALLHDIGKSGVRYSALERIFVHLYTPRHLPITPRYRGLKGAWQRHLHHPTYGAQLLLKQGCHPTVAAIVAQHHKAHPTADIRADVTLLKQIDDMY